MGVLTYVLYVPSVVDRITNKLSKQEKMLIHDVLIKYTTL